MKLVGFKTVKPRQFNYKPLFYNKEQEEFEQRLHRARLAGENNDETSQLREKMHQSWKLKEKMERKQSGTRKLIIALFLALLLLYFIFVV
ncbi:MAG: hypothetical protein IPH45_01420 [Bacteroidales bacterium]|nr:hypothetical protein [Bacteroidales bacterium]MBK7171831.1 hypothetical protein [Bacteroidales bacterium]